MIRVESLNRTYGTLHAVKNVNFSICSGEVIGLLGPNGAGKTTIMKMLCGFLEPSSGSITINDVSVARDTKLAQAHIGYLPENLPVYPEMTVVAYLEYAANLRGIAQHNIPAEIRRAIKATDLNFKALEKISALSRGLKQRVGVAQALLGSPKVLVLDEPTNGLDPTQTQQMRLLIRDLAKTATVILSTHILTEVEAVCDRVLMVKSGQLVLDSRLDQLQQGSVLQVQTSLSDHALADALAGLSGCRCDCSSEDGVTVAKIHSQAQPEQLQCVAAEVARAIVQAGGDLFKLSYEQKDLESLFKELNTAEGIADAA